MKRRIINISEELCNGCGLCAEACHEGAIGLVNGKAKLLKEDYCDGLGDCLPVCPTGAITFTYKENDSAVSPAQSSNAPKHNICSSAKPSSPAQWPVQIQLVPVSAPWLNGSDLLIAADCTAYVFPDFYSKFIDGHTTFIACPKLDPVNYSDKLSKIFSLNDIHSITLVIMEVPCCKGLDFAVKQAVEMSGEDIPVNVITISIDGKILNQ